MEIGVFGPCNNVTDDLATNVMSVQIQSRSAVPWKVFDRNVLCNTDLGIMSLTAHLALASATVGPETRQYQNKTCHVALLSNAKKIAGSMCAAWE